MLLLCARWRSCDAVDRVCSRLWKQCMVNVVAELVGWSPLFSNYSNVSSTQQICDSPGSNPTVSRWHCVFIIKATATRRLRAALLHWPLQIDSAFIPLWNVKWVSAFWLSNTKWQCRRYHEEFRGRRSSYLEQFASRPANHNSLPLDVRSTSEGSPVRLIDSAPEDYLGRALQIYSSSSSSYQHTP